MTSNRNQTPEHVQEPLVANNKPIAEPRSQQAPAGVVKGLVLAEAAKHVLLIYGMKMREYDRDFRSEMETTEWEAKYGTNLHSTGLGNEWAMRQALESLSALEPQQEEAVADEVGECRYCANTGWFYGDPDLDTYCGCAFGKLREELSHPNQSATEA